MNAFQNPLIRIIASIAVGLLLILYPNAALPTILLIIGILIGLPSLYALLIYLLSEDRNKLPFPVLSLVMLLFGCTLMLFPGWYIGITVYVLGGALVLIGVYQILYLLTLKKNLRSKAGWLSYLLPAIVLLIGIEILVNPFSATERVMVITFGAATLLYGITDLIYYIRLNKFHKNYFSKIYGKPQIYLTASKVIGHGILRIGNIRHPIVRVHITYIEQVKDIYSYPHAFQMT